MPAVQTPLPNYINNAWQESAADELLDVTNPRDCGSPRASAAFTR